MIAQLFNIIAPVFLLIFAGFAATKAGWMSRDGVDGLMSFALKFAAPCLLFLSVRDLDLSQSFNFGLLASFYVPATISFFLGYLTAYFVFGRRKGEAVAIAFAALFSNSLLLGLPISERAYGVASIDTNIAIIAVHAPFCYLLGISTMEILRADGQNIRQTTKSITRAMFKNPLMIGIGLGFITNIFNVPVFASILSVAEMLGQVTLPSALFALGGVLTRYAVQNSALEASAISGISLFVHPALAYFFAQHIFELPIETTRNLVLAAAMAPGINAFLFANLYKRAEDVAASTVLLATIATIFTASGWIWFLG